MTTLNNKKYNLKTLDFELLNKVLKQENITLEEYLDYAKIPYEMLKEWEKKGEIPAFAIIIARDMVRDRRKPVKYFDKHYFPVKNLTEDELERIKLAFWGTDYSPHFIVWIIKKLQKNIPDELFKKIINTEIKFDKKRDLL